MRRKSSNTRPHFTNLRQPSGNAIQMAKDVLCVLLQKVKENVVFDYRDTKRKNSEQCGHPSGIHAVLARVVLK